ncbi:metallophosphoesterase [Sulfolobus tengchongensis]|uniref:Metallophosphoesterase n=1 Tax=Sulfolobus tengchongensis TaxID=207809 RepID=A0AAX4L2Y7_9CREN
MLIISTSDIHSPKYLNEFFLALRDIIDIKADLAILAGDLVERGYYQHFSPIYEALKKRVKHIISTFGNEDFVENRKYYREKYSDIIWLEDDKTEIDVGGRKILIVGSEGVLEKPTVWQASNGVDENFYMRRLEKITEMICNSKADIKILVTHYASTFQTVFGERKSVYPYLGYRVIEELSLKGKECLPNIALHGHAHFAKRTFSLVKNVRVYNVALPANKRLVTIQTLL